MPDYAARIESEINPADVKTIVGGLQAFNAAHAEGDVPRYLVVSVRSDEGELVGGLVGATYLGWLHVSALWLPETLRGRGLGQAVMALAEEEALRRNCPRVFLETLSFQALGFYERLGYAIVSTIPDFPPGGSRYALSKFLAT